MYLKKPQTSRTRNYHKNRTPCRPRLHIMYQTKSKMAQLLSEESRVSLVLNKLEIYLAIIKIMFAKFLIRNLLPMFRKIAKVMPIIKLKVLARRSLKLFWGSFLWCPILFLNIKLCRLINISVKFIKMKDLR